MKAYAQNPISHKDLWGSLSCSLPIPDSLQSVRDYPQNMRWRAIEKDTLCQFLFPLKCTYMYMCTHIHAYPHIYQYVHKIKSVYLHSALLLKIRNDVLVIKKKSVFNYVCLLNRSCVQNCVPVFHYYLCLCTFFSGISTLISFILKNTTF